MSDAMSEVIAILKDIRHNQEAPAFNVGTVSVAALITGVTFVMSLQISNFFIYSFAQIPIPGSGIVELLWP